MKTCKTFREKFFLLRSSGNLFFSLFSLLLIPEEKESWKGNEDLSKRDNDADENCAPYAKR